MMNPPNRADIIIGMIMWSTCTLFGAYILSNIHYSSIMPYIAGWLFIVGAVAIIIMLIVKEGILRPREIEVKEDGICIRWRGAKIQEIPYDDIVDYYHDPRSPNTWNTRWMGGSIGLKGRSARFQLTHTILVEIDKKYYEKKGQHPPSPRRRT
jgi:hypothetical protein